MSRILVTGATGFVGRRLVPALISAGHEVRCAVSKKADWLEAEQVVIDKLELQTDWSAVLYGIDTVIHLAARVHMMKDKSESSLDEYCKVNSIATKNFAEQAAEHQVKRFIFLSSIKVNGEFTLENVPFTEESKAQPEDPYGISKLVAEQYLKAVSENTGMQVVIIRSPLVYGPGVKANFLKMLRMVNKGWPLPFERVQNRRSFIYVDNLTSALCAVIEPSNAANQVYLVSDNDALSLAQLVNFMGKALGVKVRLFSVPVNLLSLLFKLFRLSDLNLRLLGSLEVSNHKIKSQLGWTPPVSFVEGLKETVKWYQNDCRS